MSHRAGCDMTSGQKLVSPFETTVHLFTSNHGARPKDVCMYGWMEAGSDGGWLDNWRESERMDGCLAQHTNRFVPLKTVLPWTTSSGNSRPRPLPADPNICLGVQRRCIFVRQIKSLCSLKPAPSLVCVSRHSGIWWTVKKKKKSMRNFHIHRKNSFFCMKRHFMRTIQILLYSTSLHSKQGILLIYHRNTKNTT